MSWHESTKTFKIDIDFTPTFTTTAIRWIDFTVTSTTLGVSATFQWQLYFFRCDKTDRPETTDQVYYSNHFIDAQANMAVTFGDLAPDHIASRCKYYGIYTINGLSYDNYSWVVNDETNGHFEIDYTQTVPTGAYLVTREIRGI